jgi:hypothetical protein
MAERTGIKKFKGSKEELKCAQYTLCFLCKGSDAAAHKASGLGKDAKNRIIKIFERQGNASNGDRTRRPRVYTALVLEAAVMFLVQYREGFLSG